MFRNCNRLLFKWDYGEYKVCYNILDFLNVKVFHNYFEK